MREVNNVLLFIILRQIYLGSNLIHSMIIINSLISKIRKEYGIRFVMLIHANYTLSESFSISQDWTNLSQEFSK